MRLILCEHFFVTEYTGTAVGVEDNQVFLLYANTFSVPTSRFRAECIGKRWYRFATSSIPLSMKGHIDCATPPLIRFEHVNENNYICRTYHVYIKCVHIMSTYNVYIVSFDAVCTAIKKKKLLTLYELNGSIFTVNYIYNVK